MPRQRFLALALATFVSHPHPLLLPVSEMEMQLLLYCNVSSGETPGWTGANAGTVRDAGTQRIDRHHQVREIDVVCVVLYVHTLQQSMVGCSFVCWFVCF